MKSAPFEYHQAVNQEHALSLMSAFRDEARLLAGGQSLVSLMNMRLARPNHIIDINRLTELDYIMLDPNWTRIGALTRHQTIENSEILAQNCPLLNQCARYIGNPQVRNRGTIGGSIAHADPAAEYPTVVAALDGEILIRGPSGNRLAGWRDFFIDYFTVSLEPDEMVLEIRLPRTQMFSASNFVELSRRQGDFALVEVAVNIEFDTESCIQKAAIGLGGVASTPMRAAGGEEVLIGTTLSDDVIREAARTAAEEIEPLGDHNASGFYRKKMIEVLVERALCSSFNNNYRKQP
jgi:CO/xanthine dehydrogenase FAD-binding subunit